MAIVDAVIGGLIGAVGTGVVGLLLQRRRESKRQESLRKALLAELESMDGFVIWNERENEVPDKESFPTIVFESNCSKIGNLPDSGNIVGFYSNLIAVKEYINRGKNKRDQGEVFEDWDNIMSFLDNLAEERDELIDELREKDV